MSYQTNPILNRLKVVKGWKQASFPTKTLNYARDVRVWFKLYLFLKVYLLLYGLRLLTYEIRVSETYIKCVALSITKFPQKKNTTSKWKDHSFLTKVNSPLSVLDHKKGRFLLYLEVQTLKKKVLSFLNNTNHQLLSRTWRAKPQPRSWINTTFWLAQQRKRVKLEYQLTCKKKAFLSSRLICRRRLKKHHRFEGLTSSMKTRIFWTQKERTVFSLLTKMQKDVAFFTKYFHFVWQQALCAPHLTLFRLLAHLQEQLQRKRKLVRQFQKLYLFLQQIRPRAIKNQGHLGLRKKKIQLWENHFLTQLATQAPQLSPRQKRLFFVHSQILVRAKDGLAFQKRFAFFQRHLAHNQRHLFVAAVKKSKKDLQKKASGKVWKQRLQNYWRRVWKRKQQQRLISRQELPKTAILQRPAVISLQDNFFWIRLAQKKRAKISAVRHLKSKFQKSLFYRWSLQQSSRKSLTLATQVKLKYLLQDLIHKYFGLTVLVKISWPLLQFKNLKFYRFVFPHAKRKLKGVHSLRETPLLKHPRSLRQSGPRHGMQEKPLRTQKYIYVGQTTSHLKFQKAKTKASPKLGNFWHLEKANFRRRNTYLAWKRKQLDLQSQQRLHFVAKNPFMSALLTTLTLFGKYLDPQPLADHLAKLVGQTKKHAQVLRLVETVLRTFPLSRGLGYRIALSGRINGATKSKTLYLRKLKRNRPRQTFVRQVNFAAAHARALIGAFSVKIWVYL